MYLADAVAGAVISVGGVGVVAAALGICIYLVAVTVQLVLPGSVGAPVAAAFVAGPEGVAIVGAEQLAIEPDEHMTAVIALDREGVVRFADIAGGRTLWETRALPEGRAIASISRGPQRGVTALGLDDGSVMLGRVAISSRFLTGTDADEATLAAMQPGDAQPHGAAVASKTPIGQVRLAEPLVELAAPAPIPSGEGAVTLLDYQAFESAEYVVAVRADGSAHFGVVGKTIPLGGGAPRITLDDYEFAIDVPPGRGAPSRLFVTGDGQNVLVVWDDGLCQRYASREPGSIRIAESVSLVEPGRNVTAARFMLGAKTLVVGDDRGGVAGWFVARDPGASTPDRSRLVRAHVLEPHGAPTTAIGPSERDRTFVTGDAHGGLVVRNMTSHKTIAKLAQASPDGAGHALAHVSLSPKGDAIVAFGEASAYTRWSLEPGHPDATVRSLFGKVWYEGEAQPSHTYQSTGGETSEPKLGLTPLIWGTLKATVYAMLVATPTAILAAIFTSEFLGRRARATVKPVIETMASLPSVVLGFLAAIVLAPAMAAWLPGVLLAFIMIPIATLLAAHAWNYVPPRVSSTMSAVARLGLIGAVALGSGAACLALAPAVERALFTPTRADLAAIAGRSEPVALDALPSWVGARVEFTAADQRRLRDDGLAAREGRVVRPTPGDASTETLREAAGPNAAPRLRSWLDGVYGDAWPGWLALAFPFAVVFSHIACVRLVDPRLARLEADSSAGAAATVEMVKALATLAFASVAAYVFARALQALGLDPRDSFVGTFDQRNTLVVAIVMAVAITPIIYTICDDAMTSVPEPLRSASLAAGATRWQTAVRVTLPVAASGVFSACMIGLGRAAGETMIVLMATGNTPVMSLSLFDGMRTLSANIATELPEAARESTHYRVLFLCGLALFVMTFAVNTVAEIVRQRFRKKSAAL